MPRQDVPYGGAICRLRERIAEIFDLLGQKLHSINGVEGDGQGDISLVSGDAAVVITNDPTQNEIAVSLDTSQLPAAAVSSVNGQTGAVALDAGDIPTVGGSGDVQADLQDLANDISGNTAAINAEVLARQGADSTLQTNINAATASIPGAAAAAVAADNTIVRTSGNQNIADIKTVVTEATGTYSQQIANSQKVKNELDNYNPMVRDTGNKVIYGAKCFVNTPVFNKNVNQDFADHTVLRSQTLLRGVYGNSNTNFINDNQITNLEHITSQNEDYVEIRGDCYSFGIYNRITTRLRLKVSPNGTVQVIIYSTWTDNNNQTWTKSSILGSITP